MAAPSPLAYMTGISKSYPGVKALDNVTFDVKPGEVHCLVGENGAGKSTLMRILSGAEKPDKGTIEILGKSYSVLDPNLGHNLGIAAIYQETDLVMAMTVAQNIFLGHEPTLRGGLINYVQLYRDARRLMDQFGLNIRARMLVRDLSPANRQLVQIVKALSRDNRILILDEPSAKLASSEIEHLFELLRRFKEEGLGIIYISHHLNEVLDIGDRVTVLRDGKHVTTCPTADVTQDNLIEHMVGRSLDDQFGKVSAVQDEVMLSVKNLTVKGQFEDVSFDLRKGEVLALAGLVGAGRTEVLECLFGVTRADHGEIFIDGRKVRIWSPAGAVAQGIGLVPEERRESGLVLERPVAHNISFPILDRVSRMAFVVGQRLLKVAQRYVDQLNIRISSLKQPVRTLSGGNQQKVVLAKWLAADAKILLLDEPTRGIDVNAKSEIYHLINELAQQGVAILMASSELPEILGISDRVLVMAEGQLAAELITAETDQVEIMRHAVVDSNLIGQREIVATVSGA